MRSHTVSRRLPAIPLVTIDPYTNSWSLTDRLTDDWSRHWTGTRMALYGAVRVDGTAYRFMGGPEWLDQVAAQLSVEVEPTATEYRFRCGPVELSVRFVSPLLLDDLDLLSRPVCYLVLRARTGRSRAPGRRALSPALDAVRGLARRFAAMVRDRNADALDLWLVEAAESELMSFAQGLKQDEAAVRAALTLSWSSGAVEGNVTRLKLIKRQAYGRAKLDLLRARLLHAA